MGRPLGTAKLSWKELAAHRQPGDLWVGIKGQAYDVSEWAKRHPGGELVLLSAGLDCTDEFGAYHPAWVERLLQQYCVGRLDPPADKPHTEVHLFTPCKPRYQGCQLQIASNTACMPNPTFSFVTGIQYPNPPR